MNRDPRTEMVHEFMDLNGYRAERLLEQGADLEHAYQVVQALQTLIGHTDLYRLVNSHYLLSGVNNGNFDDCVRTIELLILPYAVELSEVPQKAVYGTIKGFLARSNIWGYRSAPFDAPMKLTSDALLIQETVNELRTIAAIEGASMPRNIRDRVISFCAGQVLMLSHNTPLQLLLKERPAEIDRIVAIIRSERETDGDRIREMLDSDSQSLLSGAL